MVSDFRHVLEGHAEIRKDDGAEGCITVPARRPSIDTLAGTAAEYRNVSYVELEFV
jgi:hypothetical protein